MAGGAVVGALRVTLGIDTAAFEKGASLAQKQMAATGKRFEKIGASILGIGSKMSLGITAPFTALAISSSKAATESAQAMGQVNAALASMGDASGRTSAQLAKSAEELMKISTYDDDEILRKVTANMLTFGKVSGESFDRAQLAAINLATRLGGDLQGATIMIGKALNDPVKGLTAMGKAGIQFTADQKEMIKGMVASGNAAGAQAIILKELERQFGGSAAAMRAATPGVDSKQAWDNFQEVVGKIVNDVLPPLTALLTRVLEGFNNLSPGMQTTVIAGAAVFAALGPVVTVFGGLITAFGSVLPLVIKLAPAFKAIQAGLLIMRVAALAALPALIPFIIPLGAIALAAGAAYLAFKNWDKITAIAKAIYTGVKTWINDKLGAVIDWAKKKVSELIAPFAKVYDVLVGHSIVPDMVDRIGDEMGRLDTEMVNPAEDATARTIEAFTGLFQNVTGSIKGIIGAIKNGDWLGALQGVIDVIGAVSGSGIFKGKGGGGAKVGDIPGFAHGGQFKVGGRGGIDKNLVQFRATRGEMVDIRKPGNDNGGRVSFDLRGAVMTQDLLNQMNAIGDGAAMRGAVGGSALAQGHMARRGRRRLA